MKKLAIPLIIALVLVISGITAVSAYEGHAVDVRAHVENAIMVQYSDVNFGTVFPENTQEFQFNFGTSQSFRDQKGYSSIVYKLYWERKATTEPGPQTRPIFEDPAHPGYYIPIYPYITTKIDGIDTSVVATTNPDVWEIVPTVGTSPWSLDVSDNCDLVHFLLTPPVFPGWYNAATDALNGNTGILLPAGDFYTTLETAGCGFQAIVPHTDLGSDFKIQIVKIVGEGNVSGD